MKQAELVWREVILQFRYKNQEDASLLEECELFEVHDGFIDLTI